MTRLLGSLILVAAVPLAQAGNWPQWRGPTGDSICPEPHVPLHWGEGQNVAWKCPLPDGASTPAIWGDAIFVTGEDGDKLLAFRIDAATGQIAWTRQVGTGTPARERIRTKAGSERLHQRFHRLQNLATPSPATDGAVVVVHYGSGELVALDFAGQELWRHDLQKEYGDYTVWYGHANSPVFVGDLVVSACMQDSLSDVPGASPAPSYLVAHDKKTGQERWRTSRATGAPAEQGDAYTTPLLATIGGRQQVVVMGGNQLDAYDPVTGKQLWYLPNVVGGRTVTGPTAGAGLVFATQGMSGPLLAVRPGAGKLGESNIVWTQKSGTPDTCCPVVWQDLLYWVTDKGIANCVDALTGESKWKERLPGEYKASPVVAEGRVYFLNLAGLCTVAAAGPKFQKLAENALDDGTIASPAFADGRLYLRGRKALYCIR